MSDEPRRTFNTAIERATVLTVAFALVVAAVMTTGAELANERESAASLQRPAAPLTTGTQPPADARAAALTTSTQPKPAAQTVGNEPTPDELGDTTSSKTEEGSRPGITAPGPSESEPRTKASTSTPTAPTTSPDPIEFTPDQGVDDSTIRLGFLTLPVAFLRAIGYDDPEYQRVYSAFATEVNNRGGVHGRMLDVFMSEISNPPSQAAAVDACNRALGDEQGFLLLADGSMPGVADCAAGYGQPMLDNGYGPVSSVVQDDFDRTGGLYWTLGPAAERLMPQWVSMIADEYGTDTQTGLMVHTEGGSMIPALRVLEAELEAHGFPEPAVWRHHDEETGTAQEAPTEAEKWRDAGVTLVLPLTNALHVAPAQRAFTSQRFFPDWSFSSIGIMDNPAVSPYLDPQQHDGALGISWVSLPREDRHDGCKAILQAHDPSIEYNDQIPVMCHLFYENVAILERAGRNLHAGTWVNAIRSLGDYSGNYTEIQSYSFSKQDGADAYRKWRFDVSNFEDRVTGSFEILSDWLR